MADYLVGDEKLRPDPHPLDFDWRFDEGTVETLFEYTKGDVLLVGCPTVAHALAQVSKPSTLIDRQPTYANPLIRQIKLDLRFQSLSEIDLGEFDVSIIDSPWYPEYLLNWTLEACCHVKLGGKIIVSIWPMDTRPTAGAERDLILQTLNTYGVAYLVEKAVHYRTPLFEFATSNIIGDKRKKNWRSGDLIVMELREKPGRIVKNDPSFVYMWHRYIFGSRQIAIKTPLMKPLSQQEPGIQHLWKHDIVPDVSRRLTKRAQINYWTSENRALSLNDPWYFSSSLDMLTDWTEDRDTRKVNKALDMLGEQSLTDLASTTKVDTWNHYD